MVRIRNFEENDLFNVMNIADISLQEDYDEEVFLTIMDAWNAGIFVAEVQNTLVGFISGTFGGDVKNSGRILMLAVHPYYRRSGIGSSLMDTFEDHCISKGVNRITLEVRPSNEEAIEFYMSRGYKPVKIMEDFYSNGEKGVKMERYL